MNIIILMKKIFLFILIISIFIFPFSVKAQPQTLLQQIEILQREIRLLQALIVNFQLEQEITADSYLAVDLSNNAVLLAKNNDQSYPIASITKLMSSLIALEQIEANQEIRLRREMLRPAGRSPSLFLGARVSAKNLIKASLIQSSNDASEALAHFLGEEKFINLMNQKARELEMDNTIFYDAHGISPNNRSSANDLVKLLNYISQQQPEIWQITRNNNLWLPNNRGKLLKFRNTNHFYPLNRFVGGKTGWIPEAKQTFAGIFQINDRPVAIIVLRSDNRQADVFTIYRQLQN